MFTADILFREIFLPLYPQDAGGVGLERARSEDANPARNPALYAHQRDAADRFVQNAGAALGGAIELDYTDASVHRLSAALTTACRDRLLAEGACGTADNALFNVVVHGSAYVGECIVAAHAGVWQLRRPLWESLVRVESHAGIADLAVFHWWLKALADDAATTLADRYRTHVENPRATFAHLPPLHTLAADGSPGVDRRALPPLTKPRYASFHQYLRAHVPRLRDLGRDFPSPERFDELGLRRLSFLLVGDGRMLVAWGPSSHGLHAFWLSAVGFEKSAFWPCDGFPEPIVRAKDDAKLEILLSQDGRPQTFEVLSWGP